VSGGANKFLGRESYFEKLLAGTLRTLLATDGDLFIESKRESFKELGKKTLDIDLLKLIFDFVTLSFGILLSLILY
jgi:hypothetical protein